MLNDPAEVQGLFPVFARSTAMFQASRDYWGDRLGEVICGHCAAARLVDWKLRVYEQSHLVVVELACRQCGKQSVLVWYAMEDGTKRTALFHRYADSAIGPAAPAAVSYYCEQARLSQSAGANSAAVVMYRAAVEQVLTDKGCTTKTCGGKLNELEADLKKGDPKADWAKALDTDLIRHLKVLGDGGTHGDAKAIAEYDEEMVGLAEAAVRALLYFVYEEPAKKAGYAAALKAKASLVKK